jgi:hypothetical protein
MQEQAQGAAINRKGNEEQRLARVLAAIDAANAKDPVQAIRDGQPVARALLYGRRMTERLEAYAPDASALVRIAARAQHIERWKLPRQSYSMDRIGYLKWRKELQHHHAQQAGDLMREAGYEEAEIARVGALIRKEGLKSDPDTQLLEDVICLVFLQHEAAEFIAAHDDQKVIGILAKTARKMSDKGLAAAAKLALEERLARLLRAALCGTAGGV